MKKALLSDDYVLLDIDIVYTNISIARHEVSIQSKNSIVLIANATSGIFCCFIIRFLTVSYNSLYFSTTSIKTDLNTDADEANCFC